MGKVDKKLLQKNAVKSKDLGSIVSKTAINFKVSNVKHEVKDVLSEAAPTFKTSSPHLDKVSVSVRSDTNVSNKEKKRSERREARALKLHARTIEKKSKKKPKTITKHFLKGKSVNDLISTDLVTKSQSTIDKSKKIRGKKTRNGLIKKKISSLEESLSQLSKVDLNSTTSDSETIKVGNKKEKRKQKREDLLLKLHGGIEKRKKKDVVKKIVQQQVKSSDNLKETLKTLFESDLVANSPHNAIKEAKPKKINRKTKDHKDRRIGYEAFLDVHKNPEYRKNPFEMMSKAIKASL